MKELLQQLQERIAEIDDIKYVDEDWGQLDYYSPNMPVQWPCCLIDIQSVDYSNLGNDFSKTPKNRQNARVQIAFTLANMKLSNTSIKAPRGQKDNAWQIFDWVENLHQKLHGFSPLPNASKLIRSSFGRVQRDDGVQEYKIAYTLELYNV